MESNSTETSLILGAFTTPEDILADSAGLCQIYGVVDNVRLFCRSEHPRRVFCMINMPKGAEAAARAIDGHVIGTIVCRLLPVSTLFHCPRRRNGKMLASACDDCFLACEARPVERAAKTV
ncbi:hypothetical protein [Propionivibrio sp.]|jgi:hypothetical protein|uniref:hypothetical protein n=1 Tax=Propionivibrio sp. TaxID=2212460 RepID=UPI00272E14F8|nr:hypothetical protein [Propionivibrio sp.]